MWHDFREAEDPEAPTTVHTGAKFPYENFPKKAAKGSTALPDPGTLKTTLGPSISHSSSASSATTASAHRTPLADGLQGRLGDPRVLLGKDERPLVELEGVDEH